MTARLIRLFSEYDSYNDDGARVSEIIKRHVEAMLEELISDAQAQSTGPDDETAYQRAEIETMTSDAVGFPMICASAKRNCLVRMRELGMQPPSDDEE